MGDKDGALAAYQESLAIARTLAARDRNDPQAQRDLFVSVLKVGNAKLDAGDRAGALAANQEAVEIARKLAAEDQANAQAQSDLALGL